ncbi:FAD-dependent monooxygenase [Umezawaea endophytica]|uniref:FAD-dependent monooxygenase n=1 Tax=Umezawaea endophytica TaxID=1654476 RepID=A0A9X2VKF6_9PSEU|nr:FAD-dependent monooxygenase [Umezawaea endophytica]MCS7476783.1 FAD-dependent monooxygenase [Umezawaea endophytica]
MSGTGDDVGVLVVGAGPTGLTLGLDLARRGVPCRIVEATTERAANPRCNTTSARSMEIFRRLGVADDVREAGLPRDHPTSIQYRTTLRGPEIHRIPLPSSGAVLEGLGREGWPTPEPQHRISQLFLEPILERHADRAPGLTVERGCRLVDLRQHADHVEATVESDGRTRTLRCEYVVGCDGAHSVVRRHLGVRYRGVEAIRRFVSTFVRSPELGRLAARDPAWTYWTFGRRPSALIAVDGEDLWLNHVAFDPDHDTDAEDPEQLLQEAVGGPVEHEVLGVVRWTGRQLVADGYQRGRVFLAGDAAHLWIPVGGFGMNAGIQDAATLAWMLAAVHRGWAPTALLGAYELERKPVGEQFADAVGRAARASLAEVSPDIHLPGTAGDLARADLARRLATTEPHRYSPDGFSFGYHYADSPIVLGGDARPPVDLGTYDRVARPGFRLPHVWFPDGRSVLDVLGPDFTLVRTGGGTDVSAWETAAAELGVPLTVLDLPERWPKHYPSDLVLVRPDQHVAWMGATHDRPGEVLGTATGRFLPPPTP